MYDTYIQSLKHMALVKIATALWNQADVGAFPEEFYHIYYNGWLSRKGRKKWEEIEDKVVGKVSQLSQPEPLKKEIMCFIKPIGLQILKMILHHGKFLRGNFVKENLNRLSWTSRGTVDSKKAAEILIKDVNLDVTKRYQCACVYCFEDDIRELWNKIPEHDRKYFYPMEHNHTSVVIWTYDITGEIANMVDMVEELRQSNCSPYQYACKISACTGNKAAVEYFLQKLNSSEREETLVSSAGYAANLHCRFSYGHCNDVLCFLLRQMNEEQQIKVFKNVPEEVLRCFLDWPCQTLFMEAATRMWDFLSKEGFEEILGIIVGKVINGYKDCDYQKLFTEFWQQSHNAHKRYVIGECTRGSLLSKLFQINDEKNIKLILTDSNRIEKKKLIFGIKGQRICQRLVYGDEWNLLELLIRECISSKIDMILFKVRFKFIITRRCSCEDLAKTTDKWNKFFQLLDNFICGYNIRKNIEERDSCPAKRLCSIKSKEVLQN